MGWRHVYASLLSGLILFAQLRAQAEGLRVIVVGGSSGMGKALAKEVVRGGGRVLLASRSVEKLDSARTEVLAESSLDVSADSSIVTVAVLDASAEEQVDAFAESLKAGEWDGLVVSCADKAPHGAVCGTDALPTKATRGLFDVKFWGAYHCCKHIAPKLAERGAIVFVAGVLNRRPGLNCAPLAATNGALEGLTRALALELGPRLRVNCLSPGFCATERFDHMDPTKRDAMLRNTADSLPLRRVGEPSDMGKAILYLLTASFCTGVVLDVDGGHGIRQYASTATDPMRSTNSSSPQS